MEVSQLMKTKPPLNGVPFKREALRNPQFNARKKTIGAETILSVRCGKGGRFLGF